MSPPGMTGPVIAEIGEIRVTSSTVWTPAGEFPLRGSEWTATDQWITEQRRPAWAVVLAVLCVCFTFALSLFLLRLRRTVSRGVVQVTVRNGPYGYTARVQVTRHAEAQAIYQRVNYVRSLAAL
jgi:urease accessory protein UreF